MTIHVQVFNKRMGWSFSWASSFGSDFNADFNVWIDEEQHRRDGMDHNYCSEAPFAGFQRGHPVQEWQPDNNVSPIGRIAAMSGTDVAIYTRDRPGIRAFALEGGDVYHIYSSYARGVDGIWCMFQWLDHALKGRNEHGVWRRRRHEYGQG